MADDIALRRELEGETPEQLAAQDAEAHQLFRLDFGLVPTMRIGHWLYGNGIGSTLIDMGTDPFSWIGPDLALKAGSMIARKLATGATARGAATLAEVYKAEPALKGLTAPMEAVLDTGEITQRFEQYMQAHPAEGLLQSRPSGVPLPHEAAVDYLRKAPAAIRGIQPTGNMELGAIGNLHDGSRRWVDFLADQERNALATAPLAVRKQMNLVLQGQAPLNSLPPEWRPWIDEHGMVMPQIGQYAMNTRLTRGFIQDYARRALKKGQFAPGAAGARELSSFTTAALRRKITNYADFVQFAQSKGYEVEDDVAVLIPEYIRSMGKASADKQVLDTLSTYRMAPGNLSTSLPIVAPDLKRIPEEFHGLYEVSKHPTILSVAAEQKVLQGDPRRFGRMARAQYADIFRNLKMGRLGSMPSIQEAYYRSQKLDKAMATLVAEAEDTTTHAYVMKEANPELKRLWDVGKIDDTLGPGKLMKGALWLNSFAKRINTSLAAFHLGAITGAASQMLGAKFWRYPIALKQFGQHELLMASDLVEDAIRSGVSIGAPIDAELGIVKGKIGEAADWLKSKNVPVLPSLMSGFEHVQGKIDRYLWDYSLNGYKVFAYNELLANALRNPKFANYTADMIKRSVAQHVNSGFGGLLWQRLFGSRQGLNAMRLLMFAPDWTLSNMLTAGDVMTRTLRLVPGARVAMKDLLADDVRAYFARQYAFRTRLYMSTLANLANYTFTSFKGEGHFMDENKKGAQNWVEMPWNDARGKPQYYKLGKHFTEMTEALRLSDVDGGPFSFFKKKLAPVPQYLQTMVFGRDIFDHPIVGVKDGMVEEAAKRLAYSAEAFEPMGLSALRKYLYSLATHDPKQRHPASAFLSTLGIPVRGAPSKKELATRPFFNSKPPLPPEMQ